ncbi:MAG: tetratricopeptide repeat protein [Gammaproteobacteria bacterium]|nr:tetratricopeptide repeat protein [Gammaproteobacteria bacterium]
MSIDTLKNLLAQGQDSMILRFGLGQALLKADQASEAVSHLQAALKFDPEYSAAWKLLGKALAEIGENSQAIESYEKGIAVAEHKGDIQAVKEMRVFLKRLQKLTREP